MVVAKPKQPIAFMSYVRLDDEHDEGRLTQFRERLSSEIQMHTGEEFPIFQDRNDIKWGENWKKRIEQDIDASTFLIPIITPSFFKSPACRGELERFLERERTLGRDDLILPVYYVDCPLLSDEAQLAKDKLAQAIAAHQWADWRDLRFEPFTSPEVGKTLARMAIQIRDALERSTSHSGSDHNPAGIRKITPSVRPRVHEEDSSTIDSSGVAPIQLPSRKTEPPIRVVDQLHRGDHTTISEAITAASPGDRILVRPGLYEEGLELDKPLEIVGDGQLEDIVIQAKGSDVILFRTTMGRVTNLTLRQIGGEGKWFAVDIAQGRLELEGCDISSQSLACVAIHDGADPRLRRNRIHNSSQSGVYIHANGAGTLEDNDIFANAYSGVAIKQGGNPTLRRNRIHDGKHDGVFVYESGLGTLEDNDIFANQYAGIRIKSGGAPLVRNNRITENTYEAVWITDEGAGTFEDNDLRGNGLKGAWDIADDCLKNVKRTGNIEAEPNG